MNPYATLDIPKDAKPDRIRRAYRKKAAAAHPDNPTPVGDFHAITAAHKLLADPAARQVYDATGIVPGENKLDEAAMMLIVDLVGKILQSDPNPDMDFVKKVKMVLGQLIAASRETIKVIEQSVKKIEERWKGADSVKALLLLNMNQRIAITQQQAMAQKRASEMLDGATYAMPEVKADSILSMYFARSGQQQ